MMDNENIIEEENIENEMFSSIEDEIAKKKEESIKRQRDYNNNGKFLERTNNVIKNSSKIVDNITNMVIDYNQIPMNWASKKAEIIREKEIITNETIEQRKLKMDNICDMLEEEIESIENNTELSDDQKEELKAQKYAELEKQIYLIEEYPNLSMKEQDEKLDEELESIDHAIYEDRKLIKKKMIHVMNMQILLLGRYLKKGYEPKEIYEALKILAEIELDDKELEKTLHNAFDETLMRNPDLQKIYIAYSEKRSFENEKKQETKDKPIKNGIDLIEELLNKAERDLDKKSLDRACDLIQKMPESEDKNDFQARAAEINELIINNRKGSITDTSDDTPPKPEIPKIEDNSPKKSWKTWVALATGIGVGAAVFFTCGTVGVSVMAISGGIAKRLISKRRKKLELQRLNGEIPVESVEEPLPGIKGKIQKLKEYFKSEEFCRDAIWFLNGAIYTGLGLNVASSIYNLASAKMGTASVDTTNINPTNPTPNNVTTVNHPHLDPTATASDPTSGITIGNKVGGYNVSVGHDTANLATSGSHAENLISQYVNSGSIFKRFAVMNPDGTVAQMINTNGLSISDFCAQSGIDPSQIAVDVANKNGVSQAWVSVSELIKGVGGKSL